MEIRYSTKITSIMNLKSDLTMSPDYGTEQSRGLHCSPRTRLRSPCAPSHEGPRRADPQAQPSAGTALRGHPRSDSLSYKVSLLYKTSHTKLNVCLQMTNRQK